MPTGESSFSAEARERSWALLEEETFDVVVIGAGVTGAGIARDGAGRGMKVALVDAGDLGGGTSSRSSRLAHGGLRYLETFDFGLVFEALRERRRLLELAPHLVHPLAFLFPVFRGDPTGLLKLTAGMWLYEGLSLLRSPRHHRMLGRSAALEAEPNIRSDDLQGGALYYDAQLDDARLALAIARAAHEAGAAVLPRARVTALRPAEAVPGEVDVEDVLDGRRTTIRGRVIVNATGPWSDRVRALAEPGATPRLRTTKGVHVLVDRDRIGNRNAIIFRSSVDDRVMFVLPWGDFTYIGTTDTEFTGDPADANASDADVDYILTSANSLFPAARLTAADVFSTWAGVRPLLAPDRSEGLTESATSREHEIWRDASGLLNIAGGKLTTYRSMAAETTDVVAEVLKQEFMVSTGRYYTEYLPLPGAPDEDTPAAVDRGVAAGLDPESAQHLVDRYGSDAGGIVALIEEFPGLGEPILPERPYLRAEVVFSVRSEMALTLEDVLRRRLQIFYDVADGGRSIAEGVARLMGDQPELGWNDQRVAAEVDRYVEAVVATRPSMDA